jgi:dGTPase
VPRSALSVKTSNVVADLSALAFSPALSLGRRYPEAPHPYRDPFQRDRDRVIHSRAFRRLEDKTQVFGAGYSDHFRNRLTHTMEVAQIARTVAEALNLNEDLTEALALVHDIGHPPFAHAGEEELDRQMRRFGSRFEHNEHALRIVETFEQRYAAFPGLNLTFEVREGIVKHSRDYERGESPALDEYLPGLRPPLEAQLIDLADEAAYNTADLDDAFAAAFFSMDELAGAVPLAGAFFEECQTQYPASSERLRFCETLRRLIGALVGGLIEGTRDAVREAGVRSVEDVRRHPIRLARFAPEAAAAGRSLKAFLHARVYHSDDLKLERTRSREAIAALFQFFLDRPEHLPPGYLDSGEPLHRAVCDYIAGMTDGFFDRTFRHLIC